MEEITEFEGEINRKTEATATSNDGIDSPPRLDIQSDNQSNHQRQCRQTERVTNESTVPDNSHSRTERAASTPKKFYNFKLTMLLQYSKEFLGFLALILTTYATLLNKEPIIGGPLAPKPIFAKDSIVQEWPYGHLVDVQSKVAVSELSLIFFYAPWCAESLFAKRVYNAVANLYSKEAYFAAVNCWQPSSGCRTNYSNVYKWPVLMAYFPKAFSVQYNGAWTYSSLSRFVDGLLTPIVRIHSVQKLMQLRIANDAVVFGVFPTCDSKEYQIFFQTAIKWLENDSFQNVKFAVYIGRETSSFLQTENIQAPVIKLFTTNDTIIYNNIKWESKRILNYLKQSLSKSSIWISLSSIKSLAIQKYLNSGPVLLMFAPRVPSSHHYFIMKQIIYSHKTNQEDLSNAVLNNYINYIQNEYPVELKKLREYCEFSKRTKHQEFENILYDMGMWEDRLYSLGVQTLNSSKHMSNDPHLSGGRNSCNYRYCEEEFFRPKAYQKMKQNLNKRDDRSPSEILKNHMQKQCFHLEKLSQTLFKKAIVEPILPPNLLDPVLIQNRTLTFLMLDSLVYSDYIRNFVGDFGIYQYSSPSPALFIVDNNGETLYMHNAPISTNSALEFVNNFYKGKLRRYLRSSAVEKNENLSPNSLISIRQINSREFSKVTNLTNTTSVVLFYSPQCALCYVMSLTLLHVSHMMNLQNVQFYRIDGTANDVCWEYTMDKYPTLLVFPQNRSIDTNVFPSTLQINVKNVFGFILSNLKPEQQLKSLINACILTKLGAAFQSCVRYVRKMIGDEINRYLLKWRRSPSHRHVFLKRLSIFNEIYLELMRARKGSHLERILNDIMTYENGNYSYVL